MSQTRLAKKGPSTCHVKQTSDASCKRLRLLNLRQELLRVVERHSGGARNYKAAWQIDPKLLQRRLVQRCYLEPLFLALPGTTIQTDGTARVGVNLRERYVSRFRH